MKKNLIFMGLLIFAVSQVEAASPVREMADKLQVELDKGNLAVLESIKEIPIEEAVHVLRLLVRKNMPFRAFSN